MISDLVIDVENKILKIKHLYSVDNYLTFNIKVKSGDFSGVSNFCLARNQVVSIVEVLSKMYKELDGHCKLNDCDSDSYLKIEMQKTKCKIKRDEKIVFLHQYFSF